MGSSSWYFRPLWALASLREMAFRPGLSSSSAVVVCGLFLSWLDPALATVSCDSKGGWVVLGAPQVEVAGQQRLNLQPVCHLTRQHWPNLCGAVYGAFWDVLLGAEIEN